ncbi:trypsin-like serine protease [Vibrio sp. V01_P9A10T6]|uniref:trypsin-like serine protease n=1 Tax=Vibrio sp. V01_P9A10T6 TaxID=2116368 RepID=UPI000D039889|nr:trypsin-like serine protease [Vibrio sp. V01_P9A10T6]PRQ63154.1 trypsin [Vibrio sp. V01_P9A10T6]
MENKKYTKPILIGLTLVGGGYSLPASAVEGNDVLPSDAPYMVYLKDAHCTGTLIAPKTVLTALHCVALGAQKDNHAYLLHSRAQELDENGRIPHLGIKIKIVETYTANHLFERQDGFDDIAIVELESMPEGVTFLPVANQSIPLGAEVFPIGYSTSNLKRMPIPAIVAAKEHSPDYEREVEMAQCHSSKYFSNNFFTQEYSQIAQESCDWAERGYEHRQEHGIYKPNRYSIAIENPPLDSSDSRFNVNEFGTVLTKYSTFRGDSGGPLIYQGKVYGVVSTGVNSYSQVHNQATFYAGFTRPGVFNWIVDTVKKIQNKSMEKNVSTAVHDAPIVFPID